MQPIWQGKIEKVKIFFMHPEAVSQFRRHQHLPLFRFMIRAFSAASSVLPVWFMRLAASAIDIFFISFNIKNFKAILFNLSIIRPDYSSFRRLVTAYKLFLKYSFYLIDLFYLSHSKDRVKEFEIDVKGLERLEGLIDLKKGFVLLTIHMGNWEIGGAVLAQKGIIPHIVYFPDSEGTIELQRRLMRRHHMVKEIPLSPESLYSIKLLNILREGGVIAFQGDRLFGEKGVEIDFFGKKARFPKGAVMLAKIAEVPILPVFTILKGYKSYELIIETPVIVKEHRSHSSRDAVIETALKEIVSLFEKYIYRHPDQWYTFMPFWLEEQTGGRKQ